MYLRGHRLGHGGELFLSRTLWSDILFPWFPHFLFVFLFPVSFLSSKVSSISVLGLDRGFSVWVNRTGSSRLPRPPFSRQLPAIFPSFRLSRQLICFGVRLPVCTPPGAKQQHQDPRPLISCPAFPPTLPSRPLPRFHFQKRNSPCVLQAKNGRPWSLSPISSPADP